MADITYWGSTGSGQYSLAAPTEGHTILLPKFYKADASRRAVVSCHGINGTAYNWTAQMLELRTLAAMGFPVIHTDLGGLATWGNDTSQALITDAWNYMKLGWGVATDVFVGYGRDMGALAMLNYARAHPANVAALAGVVPIIGLDDLHTRDYFGLAASIETAYGGAPGYASAAVAHDPYQHRSEYSALGIPTRFWVSQDDQIGTYDIAQRFRNAGACELVSMGFVGNPALPAGYYDDVATFLRPYVFAKQIAPGNPTVRSVEPGVHVIAA